MRFITHSGAFHADEVTAYAIMTLHLGYKPELFRTSAHDAIEIKGVDDYLVDLGRVYDPLTGHYDHHQEFITRDNGLPLASAGLIWKNHCVSIINKINEDRNINLLPIHYYFISDRVDKVVIQAIDAGDTDNDYEVSASCSGGSVAPYTISDIIRSMNHYDITDDEMQKDKFLEASRIVYNVLTYEVNRALSLISNDKLIQQNIEYLNTDETIAFLNVTFNYKENIVKNYPNVLFVITPSTHPNNKYTLQAMPYEPDSRKVRISIERSPDFKGFIHLGKWIAASDSIDELVKLAEYSIAHSLPF